jgi:ketosteroid isomerase-like protein
MSQENVELAVRLQPADGVDLVQLFGDDKQWAEVTERIANLFQPDFECAFLGSTPSGQVYAGLDGFRDLWLDWLAPWATYRIEVEQATDLGDRVLLLIRDYGRRESRGEEVAMNGSAIWTIRDGKIARAEFYPLRSEALKAAGLEE